jgi:hypothetical protein
MWSCAPEESHRNTTCGFWYTCPATQPTAGDSAVWTGVPDGAWTEPHRNIATVLCSCTLHTIQPAEHVYVTARKPGRR